MDRDAYEKEINRVIDKGPFRADWDSLCAFKVPEWYQAAKFGVFIHWGVYSVPAYGDEWYPLKAYVKGSDAWTYHVKTYGPHKQFGYKDIIPLFRAERFDANRWMDAIASAGARYVVPVAEHHDGFQMYESALSHWNAAEMGPKRDILGELKQAAEARGIVLGASSHRAEHWFFMGHGREFDSDVGDFLTPEDLYWPAMPEPNHMDLFSKPEPSQVFLRDWLLRCCEIVDRYQPKLVYFDWWIQHSAFKPYLRKFAAYYYNRAAQWGAEVAITYKHDAFLFGSAVPDVERGQFSDVKPYFWQADTSVSRKSWCDVQDNAYKTAPSLVRALCDIVAKNGTLLLNIGPKADGTIGEENEAILREIGAWLHDNGEAVYGTRPWRLAQEGPTPVEEGQFTDKEERAFTAEDIRFTQNGSSLFAIVLCYPRDGHVCIRSLAARDASRLPVFHGIIRDVSLLSFAEKPAWTRTADGLQISTRGVASEMPVVFRITLK